MIHCREAYADLLELVERAQSELGPDFRFHMHFFAGDLSVARRIVELGGTMSFTGVITFAVDGKQYVAVPSGYGGAFPLWAGKGVPEHLKKMNKGASLTVYELGS